MEIHGIAWTNKNYTQSLRKTVSLWEPWLSGRTLRRTIIWRPGCPSPGGRVAGSERGLRYRACLAGALDALPIIMHADARQGWALPSCR